jgi:MOSC domain-containing protein YiiM
MKIVSIQTGQVERIHDPNAAGAVNGFYMTAFGKTAVSGPVALRRLGLEGDAQADLINHGGPDKAVNAYAIEHYAYWAQFVGDAVRPHGAFGENLTLKGLTEESACIGDTYALGDGLIQVSQPRGPCWKLASFWKREQFAGEVQASGLTGWYFRVLREGTVEAGMPLTLVERPAPEWTVALANEVMYHRRDDLQAAFALASLEHLADSWRAPLKKRAESLSGRT